MKFEYLAHIWINKFGQNIKIFVVNPSKYFERFISVTTKIVLMKIFFYIIAVYRWNAITRKKKMKRKNLERVPSAIYSDYTKDEFINFM